jgi:hypothetical protein
MTTLKDIYILLLSDFSPSLRDTYNGTTEFTLWLQFVSSYKRRYNTLSVAFTTEAFHYRTIANKHFAAVHICTVLQKVDGSVSKGAVDAVLKVAGRTQNIDCCSTVVCSSLCFYILNFQLLCKFRTRTELLFEEEVGGGPALYSPHQPIKHKEWLILPTQRIFGSNYYFKIYAHTFFRKLTRSSLQLKTIMWLWWCHYLTLHHAFSGKAPWHKAARAN